MFGSSNIFSHVITVNSLVRARGVDTIAFILAGRGCVCAFICVVKAARTFVARRTGTGVAAARQRAAPSSIGTGTGETAVLMLTAWTWGLRGKNTRTLAVRSPGIVPDV